MRFLVFQRNNQHLRTLLKVNLWTIENDTLMRPRTRVKRSLNKQDLYSSAIIPSSGKNKYDDLKHSVHLKRLKSLLISQVS